ncbi:hypothetical protein [Kordia sp.]|uniref:hypothetical protein n=1 Tax=Kordia sp. TaxID=1965332 RepID=UPI0025C703BA|nr:hypothetical protein [Kordia sp.]MCH2194389.1 hypothetical protein [Kordia sp.]
MKPFDEVIVDCIDQILITFTDLITWIKLIIITLLINLDLPITIYKTIAYMILFDTVLSIVARLRLNEKYDADKFLWKFIVKLLYLTVPIVIAGMAKELELDFKSIVKLSIILLFFNEVLSILTHIGSISMKKRLEQNDVFLFFISLTKNVFLNHIKNYFSNQNKKK